MDDYEEEVYARSVLNYAIVMIKQAGNLSMVQFESLASIEQYKITHASILGDCYLWYVVEVLERSRSEWAAAAELTYAMMNRKPSSEEP